MKWFNIVTDHIKRCHFLLPGILISHLTTEFKTNPLGIDNPRPRLAWQLQSPAPRSKDKYQSAWQVLVASSPQLLEADKADYWNSGKRTGASNTNVRYDGKPLVAGATCFWKVKVWDEQGHASPWSNPSSWTMGLLSPEEWQAAWITDSKAPPENDSLLFGDNPAPLFRKELHVRPGLRKAILYISGLGYYEASINGHKIGDHFLDPGWTDFRKTIPYNSFDITARVRTGLNCLGVELGNGWYNSLPLLLWGGLHLRSALSTGTPRFIARLVLSYDDGATQSLVSDPAWKVTDGPLIRNNNYIGCTYDTRKIIKGWNLPGYKDLRWRPVAVTGAPGGILTAQQQPPVRSGKAIRPIGIRRLPYGKYLVDMGRNFSGIIRLQASGPKGSTIRLRYGELLHPDGSLNVMTSVAGQVKHKGMGGPGSPDIAWQEDDLVLDGNGLHYFEPAFTFHGFRYVEVEGYTGKLTPDRITGIPLHADVTPAGTFSCSNSLFNNIQQTCRHTFLNNLFSVQSDCPHREKLGYGGDIVATSEAFMANFDMHDFYAKAVRDYADDAQPDGGLPETAPYVGIADDGLTRTSGPIGWGTVFPLLLTQLYQYYGDLALIEQGYDKAKAWVDFLDAHAADHIIRDGIGDHETIEPKQIEVTSTAFFYYNTKLLQKLALLLHHNEDAVHYSRLAQSIKDSFIAKFYDASDGAVGIHTEANQSFALYFDLLPAGEKEKALHVLKKQITEKNKTHIGAGIFGTKFMPVVLSANDLDNLACQVIGQQDFPGWGYMLANGATTLWEHWAYSDNTFSHDHPMFGSVSGWFSQYLAGIRPDTDAVAYNRIIFQPGGFEQLHFAKAEYRSPQGMIRAGWVADQDHFRYDITVPVNTTATVILPASAPEKVRENGVPLMNTSLKILYTRNGWVCCRTGSGNYHFTITN